MLPGADLRAFNKPDETKPSLPHVLCQPCKETPGEMLARIIFLLEEYKREGCKKKSCLCRRACVNFHDYADRRTRGWEDWVKPGFCMEGNKTAECYSPYKLKTVECIKEKAGRCQFGDKCAFAHVLAGEPVLPRLQAPVTREQWVAAAKGAIDKHFLDRARTEPENGSPARAGLVAAGETTPQRLEVGEYELAAIDMFPGLAASLSRECALHSTVFAVERGPGKRGAVVVRPGREVTDNVVSTALLRVEKMLLRPGSDIEFNKTFPHTGHAAALGSLKKHLLLHGQSGFWWSSQHVRVQITPDSKVNLRILKKTPAHANVAGVVRRILTGEKDHSFSFSQ